MKTSTHKTRKSVGLGSAVFPFFAVFFVVMFVAGSVFAQQGEGTQAQAQTKALDQNREQIRDNAQDPQGDLLREQIQERIKNEDGLNEQQREQLRQHLRDCDELGLDDAVVGALFDEGEPLRSQIRNQKRIIEMKREGLPIEPVMTKLQEGRRKGAGEEVVDKVCTRMEANVRTAHRFLAQAREDGVIPGDDEAEQRRTREMAMNMWRGLDESDMEQLRERARLRLREGSCTTDELTAAADVASRFEEMGIERERALRLAGGALQNGYSSREIHQLRLMVMTAHMHGAPSDAVLDTLENELRNQHQLAQMFQQMWQHGWMGPADEHGGRGGHSPGDDMGGGGPGGQGGPGDNGQHRKGGGGQGGGGQD